MINLHNIIEKKTVLPITNDNASFVRLTGPSRAQQDPRLRPKAVRLPRNANLYDETLDGTESNNTSAIQVLDEDSIASSIRSANGGVIYSNEYIEKQWKIRQHEASNSYNSLDNNLPSKHTNDSERVSLERYSNKTKPRKKRNNEVTKTLQQKKALFEKSRVGKNAAFWGLYKRDIISLEDLDIQNDSASIDIAHYNNASMQKTDAEEETYEMKLVPCPEAPDVFIQPLCVGGIDESKYKNLDFSRPYLGKKKIVTPRKFYLEQDDEKAFGFVKANLKSKN